ncbi:sigma-70 family RNA polymerase sigma factor [Pedobacter chinensis]|uniref:Sigma-70 family RNA polymerase sigma factor n=1 Tax=Pedobacter chinensis TaxID=2282421 RepID=A0A369PTR6_9SPHI|nr:sigma-70 family RNA polymerase sigma factor [Pedobacter chinensis]RDC54357.1 sigma-70 family RNA polymerase sigma factor [Pedobacter chinensis]
MKLTDDFISETELKVRLDAVDWGDVIPKLHAYALLKLQRFPMLEGRYNVENLSSSIADDAIELVFDETRKWKRSAYADVYAFLKGIVDSLIYNFRNKKEFLLTDQLPEDDFDLQDPNAGDPENSMIVREIESEISAILSSDPDALRVFDCLKDGLKQREIAEELNMKIEVVRNIIKRVHRKLNDYKLKLKAG